MSEESIHHPHDKLFKAGFGDPVNTAALLRDELPAPIAARIQWDQLRPEPGSFVDSQYRHSECDLLFSAPVDDGECYLYLLFEHQTTQDPSLALRLLRYMVRIWETHLKTNPSPIGLPVIVPIVLAQSGELWDLSTRFSSLLKIPSGETGNFDDFIPDFGFHLIELAALPYDQIRGNPAAIMILRAMKAERAAGLLDDPLWDEELMIQLPRTVLELLIRYILEAGVDKNAFNHRLQSIKGPEIQRSAMTIAQELRQEGRQEGRREGLRSMILETLEIRFGNVPGGLVESVSEISDDSRLHELFRAAIKAGSVEEFSLSL